MSKLRWLTSGFYSELGHFAVLCMHKIEIPISSVEEIVFRTSTGGTGKHDWMLKKKKVQSTENHQFEYISQQKNDS